MESEIKVMARDTPFVMEKGEHRDIFYEIRNDSGNVIRGIDIDASPVRLKSLETNEWVKTDAVNCEIISAPKTIEPKSVHKFVIRVMVNKAYNEIAYDPVLKMNKEVAFSLHTIVKYQKVAEVT